jgi:hypothetical protein
MILSSRLLTGMHVLPYWLSAAATSWCTTARQSERSTVPFAVLRSEEANDYLLAVRWSKAKSLILCRNLSLVASTTWREYHRCPGDVPCPGIDPWTTPLKRKGLKVARRLIPEGNGRLFAANSWGLTVEVTSAWLPRRPGSCRVGDGSFGQTVGYRRQTHLGICAYPSDHDFFFKKPQQMYACLY